MNAATEYVWQTLNHYKGSKLLLLLAIARAQDMASPAAPELSTNELATLVGISRRQTQRIVDALEADGALLVFNQTALDRADQHLPNRLAIPMPGTQLELSGAGAIVQLRASSRVSLLSDISVTRGSDISSSQVVTPFREGVVTHEGSGNARAHTCEEESFNAFSSTGKESNSKGEKTRAREEPPPPSKPEPHPLVVAYLSAFPNDKQPPPRADWQSVAAKLDAQGVKPEHVQKLVYEKVRQGKLGYRFAWVLDDIAEWSAKNVHVTPVFEYHVAPPPAPPREWDADKVRAMFQRAKWEMRFGSDVQ